MVPASLDEVGQLLLDVRHHPEDGPMHYHDFRPDAPHRQTLISHEQYMERVVAEQSQPSHLFDCPGIRLEFLTVDSMHAGDLGTFQDAIGSLLWLEVTNKSWYRNRRVGLDALNADLNMYYDAHQDQGLSKVTPLTMSQLFAKDPGYPFLKAKAAETRHLIDFCRSLAHLHQSGNDRRPAFQFKRGNRLEHHSVLHGDLLVSLFDGLHRYASACAAEPFAPEECRAGMLEYLQALKGLHDLWRLDLPVAMHKPLPFHIRPKAHACQHLVQDKIDLFGNPNSFWGYRDEDFVGAVKRIARKTLHPSTLEKRVCEKLRLWAELS
jgi:hypothetical protein